MFILTYLWPLPSIFYISYNARMCAPSERIFNVTPSRERHEFQARAFSRFFPRVCIYSLMFSRMTLRQTWTWTKKPRRNVHFEFGAKASSECVCYIDLTPAFPVEYKAHNGKTFFSCVLVTSSPSPARYMCCKFPFFVPPPAEFFKKIIETLPMESRLLLYYSLIRITESFRGAFTVRRLEAHSGSTR